MSSKYAALPDLDISQDVYETPDLAEDISTLQTSTSAAHSTSGSEVGEDADGCGTISYDHLRPAAARGSFKHTEIDATGVDFSDRISGKRRSYRASSRRRRRRAGAYDEEYDDDEDGDGLGEETLEKRVARLKKEVEEVRGEIEAREQELGDGMEEDGAVQGGAREGEEGVCVDDEDEDILDVVEFKSSIDELSNVLEGLQTVSGEERGAQAKLAKKLAAAMSVTAPNAQGQGSEKTAVDASENAPITTDGSTATYTVTYAPAFKQSHALAKAADFDKRLTVLEKVLGMSASATLNVDKELPNSAMIPTLDELSRQMSVLTAPSTTSLDAANKRVKQLTLEAERLAEARKAAKATADARREEADQLSSEGSTAPLADTSEREAKINALYGALPTIENLGPLLPAVLDRLRSLRTIHADAGKAVENLTKLERRQEEMGGEIARWRAALEKVETVVKESEGTIQGNMGKVEGWVQELEEKVRMVEKMVER
ncbi:Dynamitin-domain-containing protein [Tuber indicum]|nr:Dynamitin-domain-containing protein [Tuber indicum]